MNIYSEKRIKYMYAVFSLCFGMVVSVLVHIDIDILTFT